MKKRKKTFYVCPYARPPGGFVTYELLFGKKPPLIERTTYPIRRWLIHWWWRFKFEVGLSGGWITYADGTIRIRKGVFK